MPCSTASVRLEVPRGAARYWQVMSQANVEVVRQIYERWGSGDFRAGTELYDPYVLLVLRPEFPDAGAYCGPDEIRRYMRDDFLADLQGAAIVGEDFLDAGDSVVVRGQ